MLRLLADDEQFALERVLVGAVVAPANEHLAHERFGRDDALAQSRIFDGHVAPTEDMLSFRLDKLFDDTNAVRPRPFGLRHKHHADAVIARLRKIDPDVAANGAQMGVRHLNENARAVAGQRVGADRATMSEVFQNLQTLIDDPVAFPVLYVRNETDPARIVLVARVVEPLLLGQPLVSVPWRFKHTPPYPPLFYAGLDHPDPSAILNHPARRTC